METPIPASSLYHNVKRKSSTDLKFFAIVLVVAISPHLWANPVQSVQLVCSFEKKSAQGFQNISAIKVAVIRRFCPVFLQF